MKHKNRCRFRHIARSAADRCAKPLPADPVSIARGRVKPALTARAGTRARLLPLSDNGTVVVVKEPRRAVLTPLAVPMSLASSPLRLDRGVLNWLSSIGPLASGGPSLGRPGRSCPVPGCGRHRERAGVGRPAAGAVRLVEAGQAAGRGSRLHGDVASLGVHYHGQPRGSHAQPGAGPPVTGLPRGGGPAWPRSAVPHRRPRRRRRCAPRRSTCRRPGPGPPAGTGGAG